MPRYLPSLSELISVENLPENLGFLENVTNTVFSSLFFKDLFVENNYYSEEVSYSITIVSKTKLALNITGEQDGLSLVLNPDFVIGDTSDFPMIFSYHWPLLKHINNFKLASFGFSFREFFDLISQISGLNEAELLRSFIFH